MKQLTILVVPIILTACTAKYDVIRHDDNKLLSVADSYYISEPADGVYETKNYVNSGKMTRDALFKNLTEFGIKAKKGVGASSKSEALLAAKEQNFDVLIYPTILHWEDRATEWSGLRDRAKIKLELIDTETGVTVDNTMFDLVGTWWTLGGLHPEDMLDKPARTYFKRLFGAAIWQRKDGTSDRDGAI